MPKSTNENVAKRRDAIKALRLRGLKKYPEILAELKKGNTLNNLTNNYDSLITTISKDMKVIKREFDEEANFTQDEKNEQLAIFKYELIAMKDRLKGQEKGGEHMTLKVIKEFAALYGVGSDAAPKIHFDQTVEMTFNKMEQQFLMPAEGMSPDQIERYAEAIVVENAKLTPKN